MEHSLIERAGQAERCHRDNANQPREPGLSESEKADTMGFLREMLRILPLLGVRLFERPAAIAVPSERGATETSRADQTPLKDTIVVPAKEGGFKEAF